MKAMVLAAGEGQRLLPLTLHQAKPAVPVLGRPLLVHILHRLGRHGVDDVVLNLHHHPESIRAALGGRVAPGLPAVRFSHEEAILGTAGGIRRAASLLRGDGPIVVCNSDCLCDVDLHAALEAHRRSGCLATLILAPARPGYTRVGTDSRGRVLSFGGEPEPEPGSVAGEHLFTGYHILEESAVAAIPDRAPCDIVRDVYRALCPSGGVGAYFHEGFWWEFGSPELYLEGSLRLLDYPPDRLREISGEHDPLRRLDEAAAAVGPGAEIEKGARFRGRVALGYASHVAEDALVEDSIVMPEAWIGPGCRLRRTIVGQDVELPAGFVADGAVICADPEGEAPPIPRAERTNGLLVLRL